MARSFPCSSTIAPAPEASSLDTPASTRVTRDPSAAGPSSAVVSFSVDLGAGPSSCAGLAMAGRSSTSLVPASPTLSLLCVVVTSSGLSSSATRDVGASNAVTLSCQLAVARRQRDSAG